MMGWRGLDLAMMEFHNGKERDYNDWLEVLERADPRYQLVSINKPPESRLAMLEVGWRSNA